MPEMLSRRAALARQLARPGSAQQGCLPATLLQWCFQHLLFYRVSAIFFRKLPVREGINIRRHCHGVQLLGYVFATSFPEQPPTVTPWGLPAGSSTSKRTEAASKHSDSANDQVGPVAPGQHSIKQLNTDEAFTTSRRMAIRNCLTNSSKPRTGLSQNRYRNRTV